MIDWLSVVTNSFWIAGLAIVLATVSYGYWLAGQQEISLLQMLQRRQSMRFVYLGLVLVGVGLTTTSSTTFETILGGLFTLGALLGFLSTVRPESEA